MMQSRQSAPRPKLRLTEAQREVLQLSAEANEKGRFLGCAYPHRWVTFQALERKGLLKSHDVTPDGYKALARMGWKPRQGPQTGNASA